MSQTARNRAGSAAMDCIALGKYTLMVDVIERAILAAEQAARADERERNCVDVCLYCANGWAFDEEKQHHFDELGNKRLCDARKIRARGAK